jgi:hypothetical protein
MKNRITWPAALLVLFASILSAQMGRFSIDSSGVRGSTGIPPAFAIPVTAGAPYSGEEYSESVQTLSDGIHITQKNLQRKVYRDSEGRIRNERPLILTPANGDSTVVMPMVIEISDPVAGFQYALDTQRKIAHRQILPPPSALQMAYMNAVMSRGGPMSQMATVGGGGGGSRTGVLGGIIVSAPGAVPPPPPPAGASRSGETAAPARMDVHMTEISSAHGLDPTGTNASQKQPKFTTESLGTQTIDGVLVEGTRTTVTYPIGMMGNDKEFSSTSEAWTSPELKLMVLTKSNDPRSGENTFRINNLSRTPPDAKLFQVPADYTIVDEKGGYTITYGQP